MTVESSYQSFYRPEERSIAIGLLGLNHAVYTLFVRPPHEKLHAEVAELTDHEPQELQPSLESMLEQLTKKTILLADSEKKRLLDNTELSYLTGVLIQFTDYVPSLHDYAETDFESVNSLYEGILNKASELSRALSFPEQLEVALLLTNADLPQALWLLFITSRLHARWLDGKIIRGLPDFTHDEKLERMIKWQKSLLACKSNAEGSQDVAGDTYYTWTHALASVVFKSLPAKKTRLTNYTAKVFEQGTELMQAIVHKVSPQEVTNKHNNAAVYGNAIGVVCVKWLENSD